MSRPLSLSLIREKIASHAKVKQFYSRRNCEWAFHLQFSRPIATKTTGPSQPIFVSQSGELVKTPFSIYLASESGAYFDTFLLSNREVILFTSLRNLLYWDTNCFVVREFVRLLEKHEPDSYLLSYFPEKDLLPMLSEEQRVELALFWCKIIAKEITERGLTLDERYKRKCDMSQSRRFLRGDGYNPEE